MEKTMIGLVKENRGPGAVLKEVPVPTIGPDEVLVRVKASSICGTDVHIYNWDAWAEKSVVTGNVFGHEFAGIVEEIGSRVANVRLGDHVSAEGHMVCGHCKPCRTGNAHVCLNTRSFGITAPGCFAEYAVVKASNIILNDPDMPFSLACLQDPLGNAVQTVLSGDIVGKSVVIIGAGLIGLMSIAVAKACGAGRIIAADINPYRLDMAHQMGADVLIDSTKKKLSQAILEHTNGEGAEVVLEMSGHPEAMREGFEGAAHAARVSLLGIPTADVALDMGQIIFKGIRVEGITGRKMYETWYQMKGLLARNVLNLEGLITHTFTLDRYEEAFDLMRQGLCGKVVFLHELSNHTASAYNNREHSFQVIS
ncbi:L-threonine 3-dehydrogenase [Paenibacillus selenitireducens]|uniref:L-threonine 3-dehydrogenase n=1 Tax=Paenibacillus selenitireducens TaxID=1324314 RepID=A0A1T2X2I1_9BACL|nr:L-threonine 3-dehydrogenase [Paenibacillus selenitireducens]OPA74101.1 L-threonine 3-dehydrogenase [Paenibacillus selenitireducens]